MTEKGKALFETIIDQSGLPKEVAHRELNYVIEEMGLTKEELTLNQLRAAMMQYLENINEKVTAQAEDSPSSEKDEVY